VELLQDHTTPAIHRMMQALHTDMPGVNWEREMKHFWQGRLDVALGMIPLTLLGMGMTTVNEVTHAKALLSDNAYLGRAGLQESDRIKIVEHAANGRLEEAQKAMQDAWQRRKPEEAAQWQRQTENQQAIEGVDQPGIDTAPSTATASFSTSATAPASAPRTQEQVNASILDRVPAVEAQALGLSDILALPAVETGARIPGLLAVRQDTALGGRMQFVFEGRAVAERFMNQARQHGGLSYGVNGDGSVAIVNMRDLAGGTSATEAVYQLQPAATAAEAGAAAASNATTPGATVDRVPMSQQNSNDGTAAQPTGPASTGSDATGSDAAGTDTNTTDADRRFLGRFTAMAGSPIAPAHRPETSPAVASAELTATWLGLRLRWFSGPRSYQAVMDVDTRTAWINATRPDVTAPSLVMHEAWHQLEKSDPDLAAQVIEHFNRLGREGHVDIPGFAKWLKDRQYSEEDINAGEMIAHIAEEFTFDSKFWDTAFANDPTLGAKTLAAVLKWIDKIAILLKLKEPTITSDVHGQFLRTVEAVDTMREQLAKAYAAMAQSARDQGSKPQNGNAQGTGGKIPFSLDINPNKAVGMAAAKVPVVPEAPPIGFANNVVEAARAIRLLMGERTRAVVFARGGMKVNLFSPDHLRAKWLSTDPMTARVAHALNSSESNYKQPDPAKVRGAPLTRYTLTSADFMVRAKDHAGRESPTWIKVYQDSTSPTGQLWHFVVTDENGDFQTQYSAPSIAGTSAEGAIVEAPGDRTPRALRKPADQDKPADGEGK
jgi:hypothetical protein